MLGYTRGIPTKFLQFANLCQGRRAEANRRELSRFRAPGTAVEVAEDADSKVIG